MIKWFKNSSGPGSKSKVQISPVRAPKAPKVPKSTYPKKVKKTFHGPKSPEFFKRKLYIPKKFIMAAEEATMSPSELESLMGATPSDPVENETEEVEEVEATGGDPVEMALRSIPNISNIKWQTAPNTNCTWCLALSALPPWPNVDAFVRDKPTLVKPGRDTRHLAHNNCSCTLKVTTTDGQIYTVDSAGQY